MAARTDGSTSWGDTPHVPKPICGMCAPERSVITGTRCSPLPASNKSSSKTSGSEDSPPIAIAACQSEGRSPSGPSSPLLGASAHFSFILHT
eukprot:scaffold64701_cov39-Tisochrysis_lutea.AAC.1